MVFVCCVDVALISRAWGQGSPPPLMVIYGSNETDSGDLYLLDIGRAMRLNLTRSPGIDSAPSPSPDGRYIAFQSTRDGNRDIYILDTLRLTSRNLTRHLATDMLPAWSPAGDVIAFISDREGDAEIYAAQVETGAVVNLTRSPGDDARPAWSPDGRAIIFTSHRALDTDLYRMSVPPQVDPLVPGRLLTEVIAPDPGSDLDPAWSPDGRWLAFRSNRGDAIGRLYLLDLTSGDLRYLPTGDRGVDQTPSWSSDGRYLVFWSFRDSSNDIYLMDVGAYLAGDAAAPTITNLTDSPARETLPAWFPGWRG
jgi:TolB protein